MADAHTLQCKIAYAIMQYFEQARLSDSIESDSLSIATLNIQNAFGIDTSNSAHARFATGYSLPDIFVAGLDALNARSRSGDNVAAAAPAATTTAAAASMFNNS
jgi:hypothetical protein